MAPDDDPQDKDIKVKDLDLARWFQLPSFDQLGEAAGQPGEPTDEDPGVAEIRERRARVCAEVDPALLEAIRIRTEVNTDALIRFEVAIRTYISDAPTALFDYAMADRVHSIAEPREVEISDELKDDLKECTPQALLRDLHRPETEFAKQFDIVDVAAEQRFDIVAEVATAMATSLKLPPLDASPFEQERRKLAEDRVLRKLPWTAIPMPGRTVSE
jgi:hypothetical protein